MRSKKYLYLALGVLAVLVLTWPIFMPGTVVGMDGLTMFMPHYEFIARVLRNWQIPLYNPYIITGQPELAASQWGALYPVQIILLPLLGAVLYIKVSIILHLLMLAAASFFLASEWIRILGIKEQNSAAILLGGLVIAFSGFTTGHLHLGHLNFIQSVPYIILAGAFGLKYLRGRASASLFAAGSIAFSVLAGGAAILPYCLLVLVVVWGVAAVNLNAPGRRISGLVGMMVLAAGLVAVQVLPSLELSSVSARLYMHRHGGVGSLAFHPAFLPGFILPSFLARIRVALPGEYSGYVGIPAMGLAILPLFYSMYRRTAVVLWSAVLFMLFLGSIYGVGLHGSLPGFSLLRAPGRVLVGVDILLGLLAVTGLVVLIKNPGSAKAAGRTIMVLVILGLLLDLLIRPDPWWEWVVLLCSAFAAVFAWTMLRFGPWPVVVAAILALLIPVQGVVPVIKAGSAAFPPSLIKAFKSVNPEYRVVYNVSDKWNQGMINGFRHLGADEPFASYRSDLLLRTLSGIPPKATWHTIPVIWPTGAGSFHYSRVWDVFSVRLCLAPGNVKFPSSFIRLAHWGNRVLYENPNALPRAYFTSCPHFVDGPVQALDYLLSAPEQDRTPAAIESPRVMCTAQVQKNAAVIIQKDSPTEIILKSHSNSNGYVILSDMFYPGWTLKLDGRTAPILHANDAGMGVLVTAGKHELHFLYRPKSLIYGGLISILFLIIFIFLALRLHTGTRT